MSGPYQAVKASDGYFVIGAANQKLWLTFLDVLGRPELNQDPRFSSNSLRVSNREVLIEVLAPTFATRTVHEWVDALLEAGVPAAPIYNYEQALASDHVAAREMVMDVPHPIEGSFKSLGFPVKMRGTPQQVRYPPPLLGQHNEEIRRELIDKGLLVTGAGGKAAAQ
jgi:crotonobetainyl-CoA:carnitine CoA-transferase CaiB-like acyl-CoA transferase